MCIIDDLKPYKSFMLLRIDDNVGDLVSFDSQYTMSLRDLLLVARNRNHVLAAEIISDERDITGMHIQAFQYQLHMPVTWLVSRNTTNLTHHILVYLRRDRYVLIHSSDKRVYEWLHSELDNTSGLGDSIGHVDASFMNAAFIGTNQKIRALWLNGSHASTPFKADNKSLIGPDLREALDPYSDQTYGFSALRCEPYSNEFRVTQYGINPDQSKIWMGASTDHDDFLHYVEMIFNRLDERLQPLEKPFDILCNSVTSLDGVAGAYDILLVPPWFILDDEANEIDEDEIETWRKWAENATYSIRGHDGDSEFDVDISLNGNLIGELHFGIMNERLPHVSFNSSWNNANINTNDLQQEALRYFGNPGLLKIWYDSGHTICNGRILEHTYRDIQFWDLTWADFNNYSVDREKPRRFDELQRPMSGNHCDLSRIGQDYSLFCWLKNRGNDYFHDQDYWLMCDDGANEVADFVWFSVNNPPTLRLIHIKSASSSNNREVAPSAFEVVTSQAIKNLRYMNPSLLIDNLQTSEGRGTADLVWHNDAPADKISFITALNQAGTQIRKEVIIIQPHISQSIYDNASASENSTTRNRLMLLSSLLFDTKLACNKLGIEFKVIAEG